MNKNAIVHARIEPNIKEKAEKILNIIGIKPSQAITMFYSQVILRKGMPFRVEIPNVTTLKAIKELDNPAELESYNDVDALFAELNS